MGQLIFGSGTRLQVYASKCLALESLSAFLHDDPVVLELNVFPHKILLIWIHNSQPLAKGNYLFILTDSFMVPRSLSEKTL